MAAEAIAAFHRLVEADEAGALAEFALLEERMLAAGVRYGGRALPTSLRPRFLSPTAERAVRRASRAVVEACANVEYQVLADPRRLEDLGLPADERDWITVPAPYADGTCFSRLDGFLEGDIPRFVEFNVDSPGGAGFYDVQAEVFRSLPIVRRFGTQFAMRTAASRPRILHVLLRCFERWRRPGERPHLAIVDWDDVSTSAEFDILCRYFERCGIPTRIVDPRRLTCDSRGLRDGDFTVNLVYKRVVIRELLDRASECAAFLKACRDGLACVVNPFRVKLQTVKLVIAALFDPAYRQHLTARQLRVIDESVPWTARVQEGCALYQGTSVDLCEHVRRHQSRFVIKPNDEYGGSGVTLGWKVSAAQWDARLAEALQSPHVVQERVALPTEPFPVPDGGRMRYADVYVDCDPYFFDDRMGTIGTRFSADPILNVKTGGGVVPTFVVEPR